MSRVPIVLAVAVGALVAALATSAPAAILVGQIDDFENGTLQGWEAGSHNPHGPTNVLSGGPIGVGDNYLRFASDGAGPGGRLVGFNSERWEGDYLEAGVTSIRMQVNNLGTTNLLLRLILIGAGSLTTASPVNVAAGSGWTTVSFSLAPANLIGSSYDTVLSGVSELNLVHSPNVVGHRTGTPNIAAQLGIDNVTAVPEPTTLVLAALGFAAVMWRTARSCRQAPTASGA